MIHALGCSDRSDKTEAECVTFCASGQSLENCGVCSCRRPANIYYHYTETTSHYSGTACADANACQVACTADSNCEGYQKIVSGGVFSRNHIILRRYFNVHGVDLDGDGDIDIVAALLGADGNYVAADSKIVWYENVDEGTFQEHTLSTDVTFQDLFMQLI